MKKKNFLILPFSFYTSPKQQHHIKISTTESAQLSQSVQEESGNVVTQSLINKQVLQTQKNNLQEEKKEKVEKNVEKNKKDFQFAKPGPLKKKTKPKQDQNFYGLFEENNFLDSNEEKPSERILEERDLQPKRQENCYQNTQIDSQFATVTPGLSQKRQHNPRITASCNGLFKKKKSIIKKKKLFVKKKY